MQQCNQGKNFIDRVHIKLDLIQTLSFLGFLFFEFRLGSEMLSSHNLASSSLDSIGISRVVVVQSLLNQDVQILLVGLLDVGDSKSSGGFLVDDSSKSGLAFHDDVRDVLLLAKSWKPQNKLANKTLKQFTLDTTEMKATIRF